MRSALCHDFRATPPLRIARPAYKICAYSACNSCTLLQQKICKSRNSTEEVQALKSSNVLGLLCMMDNNQFPDGMRVQADGSVSGVQCGEICFGLSKCIKVCNKLTTALQTSTHFPCMAAGYCPEVSPFFLVYSDSMAPFGTSFAQARSLITEGAALPHL